MISQPEEGIEQDYWFHQHRTQLYNGGYGLDFANDVGRFVSYSWGTRFQIPADSMAIVQRVFAGGRAMDDSRQCLRLQRRWDARLRGRESGDAAGQDRGAGNYQGACVQLGQRDGACWQPSRRRGRRSCRVLRRG